MKKKLCRRLIALVAAFCILTSGCGSVEGGSEPAHAAYASAQSSSKTSTSITSVKQVKYESLKIKWRKIENVKKYEVYRADKATGTPAYNQKLSEKRAQNVADALVKKFGVKASQLQVVGKGGVDNLYEGGVQLSRVVIVE